MSSAVADMYDLLLYEKYQLGKGVSNKKQKKALLLHCAGLDVQDIYLTLTEEDGDDDFNKTIKTLKKHFDAKVIYLVERYNLSIKQNETETIDHHITRLKQQVVLCDHAKPDAQLHINSKVEPVAQRMYRIPFTLRRKVDKKLDELESQDIIQRVNAQTPWVSPVIVVPKPNGDIRFCAQEWTPKALTTQEIEKEAKVDKELSEVRNCLQQAKWNQSVMSAYHPVKNELSVKGYLVMRGRRTLIPNSQAKCLQLAHEGHFRNVGTKHIALMKRIRIAQADAMDWKRELRKCIMAYRTKPQSVTGVSPPELLFKRMIRTQLPEIFCEEDVTTLT
ncbi:unnamed protein product [Mytilus edulis]|uniref:Uncharacterized protein n=1 Tax=Mytilus edulis TaxID=6550 RepID=A0A8S3Q0W2_MYTED|nr:unnamed protein product [Mytilus edulis]